MTQAATLAVAVAGASGRMGRMLIEAVVRADDCRLSGALDVPGSSALGQRRRRHSWAPTAASG